MGVTPEGPPGTPTCPEVLHKPGSYPCPASVSSPGRLALTAAILVWSRDERGAAAMVGTHTGPWDRVVRVGCGQAVTEPASWGGGPCWGGGWL